MAFIGLSIIDELPWWVTVTILVREWGITIMRFVVLRYGVMAAGRGGKIKTVTQAIAVILYLLPLPTRPISSQWWSWRGLGDHHGDRFGLCPRSTSAAASGTREAMRSGLAASVLAELDRRGETLASAESLTGGMVGQLLTDVPGASASYLGGVISYATRLKATLAGVDAATLPNSALSPNERLRRWRGRGAAMRR